MSQTLRLEFACTKAEMDEAQTLNLRKRLGGGSKWRTWLVLFGLLVLGGVEVYFQMLRELTPSHRVYAVTGLLGVCVLVLIVRRKLRDKPPAVTNVEVTAADFSIVSPTSKVTMPWSTFSECLESPNLFVLLDRPRTMLWVVPKRAFPSENWQTWFRAQAEKRSRLDERLPTEDISRMPSQSAGAVIFRFQIGFRDYLDRTVASWRIWGLFLAIGLLMGGMSLVQVFQPVPDAVNSPAKVFMISILCLLPMVLIIILIVSVYAWRVHAKYVDPTEVALSERGITFAGREASGVLPWSSYARYKETLWSFILWRGGGSISTMFPKRAFRSHDDLSRARALLAQNLQRSRWFFG